MDPTEITPEQPLVMRAYHLDETGVSEAGSVVATSPLEAIAWGIGMGLLQVDLVECQRNGGWETFFTLRKPAPGADPGA